VGIQGHTGKVIDITIFSTKIQTVDTTIVIVPNSDAISGSIINYSMKDERQIDMLVGIAYGDDIDLAREVLTRIATENEKSIIDEDRPVRVIVKEL
jgi:small conductance mechanosensitive channel